MYGANEHGSLGDFEKNCLPWTGITNAKRPFCMLCEPAAYSADTCAKGMDEHGVMDFGRVCCCDSAIHKGDGHHDNLSHQLTSTSLSKT